MVIGMDSPICNHFATYNCKTANYTRICLDRRMVRLKVNKRGARLGCSMRLDANDMERLAKSLLAVAGRETEESQVALAYLAHNQIACGLSVPESCSLMRALRGRPSGPRLDRLSFEDRTFCRAFAILCQVWAGDRIDLTSGATRAHRHDVTPRWAAHARATALIGPWMFYRAD
jgi:hypothetical protein